MRSAFSKKSVLMIGVVLLGVAVWFLLVLPEIKSQRAINRYRIGISAEEIGRLRNARVDLIPSGVVYLGDPSEDDKRKGFFYSLYLPEEGVYLQFNYYRETVRIKKVSPLQKLRAVFQGDN